MNRKEKGTLIFLILVILILSFIELKKGNKKSTDVVKTQKNIENEIKKTAIKIDSNNADSYINNLHKSGISTK